jgi:hypothetical protein
LIFRTDWTFLLNPLQGGCRDSLLIKAALTKWHNWELGDDPQLLLVEPLARPRVSGQDSHPRFTLCFAGSSEPLTLLYTESLQATDFKRFALPDYGFSAIFASY